MGTNPIVDLADAGVHGRAVLGGKAAVLAELSAAGFPVPPAFIVTDDARHDPTLDGHIKEAARTKGAQRFAVRSSGAAEDLPDASYAGPVLTLAQAAAVAALARRVADR